ncbi:MAG: hypothetical protein Q9212_002974 [Teloschistes hypoglaucus]
MACNIRNPIPIAVNIAAFDAAFFAIHPTEASSMDPQQKLQLETAFEALENAGLTLDEIRGSDTAVYVAVFGRDDDQMMSKDALEFGNVLNPNGKCYPFDVRGQGYGRGEGVATLILERLDDTLAAGDCIRGVIRNTGINQDGKTAGITLPDQSAQEALVRKLYSKLNINPLDLDFVEAYGTGTVAGDQAEYKSISKMFCQGRQAENSLFVGAVKSNIGHLESLKSNLVDVDEPIKFWLRWYENHCRPSEPGIKQGKADRK